MTWLRQHSARVTGWPTGSPATSTTPRISTQECSCGCSARSPATPRAPSRGGCTGSPPTCSSTLARRRRRIRFEGLRRSGRGTAAAARRAHARPGVRRPPSRHRRAAGAGGPGAGVPGGGRAVRHRGPAYEEIAAATLGVKLGTVRSRIHWGRAQLRAALDPPSRHRGTRRDIGHASHEHGCLGERLSALIDGELNDAQRERVLAHLARCEDCRREAAALGCSSGGCTPWATPPGWLTP
mgnify:CR=1 FL=1